MAKRLGQARLGEIVKGLQNRLEISVDIDQKNSGFINPDQPISAGTGADGMDAYYSWVERFGNVVKTTIIADIDGLLSSTTADDIIGEDGVANAHIGQVTTAKNGTQIYGRMTCLEVPATAQADIDLNMSSAGTGVEDAAVTSLANHSALITAGGAWTAGLQKTFAAVTADYYLYLSVGAGGTANTYSAGIFLIELWGTA